MSHNVTRIDFALIMIAGNRTRYLTLRPLVDADRSIAVHWLEMQTWEDDHRYKRWPAFLRPKLRNAKNLTLLFRSTADVIVIHAYESYIYFAALHRLLRRRARLVYWFDGTYSSDGRSFGSGVAGMERRVDWLHRWALGGTTRFVAWSEFAADKLKAAYPASEGRVSVIHPGIQLRSWPPRDERDPNSPFRLLFVGGDAMRKGLDVLIKAYSAALRDTCAIDIVTAHGSISQELARCIDDLPNVRVHYDASSNSPKIHDLYDQADVLVLPTRLDLSSLTALEAMATGVPVVTTPVGGIPEIVIDGETGLIVNVDDADGLADAIERIRTDPDLRKRLVIQALGHVQSSFDAEKNTDALVATLKQL